MKFLRKIFGVPEKRRKIVEDSLMDLANLELILNSYQYITKNSVSLIVRKNEKVSASTLVEDIDFALQNEDGLSIEKRDDKYQCIWFRLSSNETADEGALENLVCGCYLVFECAKRIDMIDAFLCAVFLFTTETFTGYKFHLIYSLSRGNFYPYVIKGNGERDNIREIEFISLLKQHTNTETDMSKWFPIREDDM